MLLKFSNNCFYVKKSLYRVLPINIFNSCSKNSKFFKSTCTSNNHLFTTSTRFFSLNSYCVLQKHLNVRNLFLRLNTYCFCPLFHSSLHNSVCLPNFQGYFCPTSKFFYKTKLNNNKLNLQACSTTTSSSSGTSDSSSDSDNEQIELAKPRGRVKRNVNQTQSESETFEKDQIINFEQKMTESAVKVAESLDSSSKSIADDLLTRLRRHKIITPLSDDRKSNKSGNTSMQDLFTDVESSTSSTNTPHSEKSKIKKRKNINIEPEHYDYDPILEKTTKYESEPNAKEYMLFSGKALDIFPDLKDKPNFANEKISLFDILEKEERDASIDFPSTNAFEEMCKLTKKGILREFPIDNEQGITDEKNVGFHEHIFLEPLIADFPKKGPIRHFMELVIYALSSNPHITVQQKKDHIQWFREYFADKKEVIDSVVKKADNETLPKMVAS